MCIATTLVSLLALADGFGFAAPRAEPTLAAPASVRWQQEQQHDERHPVPSAAVVQRIRAEIAASAADGIERLSVSDCIGQAKEAMQEIKDPKELSARRYVLSASH